MPAINVKANNPAAARRAERGVGRAGHAEARCAQQDGRRRPQDAGRGRGRRSRRPRNLTAGITKGAGGKIIVGAADFSENQEIAELYKIALTAAGYDVTVQTIGNRELYEPELEKNKIQVVPEYAATLTEFLNTKQNGENATPRPPVTSTRR